MFESLLSSLKPRQLEAIKHTLSPQLIFAGAGTGKTTTITARISPIWKRAMKAARCRASMRGDCVTGLVE